MSDETKDTHTNQETGSTGRVVMPKDSVSFNYAFGDTPENRALVSERFTYKQWDEEQVAAGKAVTDAAIEFGVKIIAGVPPCPTRTRALNLIEEARMLANAAITHNGKF